MCEHYVCLVLRVFSVVCVARVWSVLSRVVCAPCVVCACVLTHLPHVTPQGQPRPPLCALSGLMTTLCSRQQLPSCPTWPPTAPHGPTRVLLRHRGPRPARSSCMTHTSPHHRHARPPASTRLSSPKHLPLFLALACAHMTRCAPHPCEASSPSPGSPSGLLHHTMHTSGVLPAAAGTASSLPLQLPAALPN